MRDQLLEKISSLELRTKLFEPNIQLAAAIDKARAWETAWRQASSIADGEGGQTNVNMVKDRDGKKTSIGFRKQKCYACGKMGHFARDKICPAEGKTCAKCGDEGHWADCCKSEAECKNSGKEGGRERDGRARGGKQRRSKDANMIQNQGTSKLIK